MSILSIIQTSLVAPKNQTNNFGKYNYRSCEDILEAVKPLLKEHGAHVLLEDNIEVHGDRVYICATAFFVFDEDKVISVKAYAREPLAQKGMNDSQITGSASSYARKYALNGLFCIDDNKDADTMPPPEPKPKKDHRRTEVQLDEFFLAGLRGSKNQVELVSVWNAIPPADRKPYESFKNKRKDELGIK